MTTQDPNKSYKKLRFDWKKQINASPHFTRGTKQLVSHLCDSCVGKHTGTFWHSNSTLAEALLVDPRTVQRYLKELEDAGWLRRVRVKNKRRAFQIAFPRSPEGDSRDDKVSSSNTTQMSSEGDMIVAPYKNQVLNQEKRPSQSRGFQSVLVSHQEENSLTEWTEWLTNHPGFDASDTLNQLECAQGYLLPSRYPRVEDKGKYEAFFEAAMASNGFSS